MSELMSAQKTKRDFRLQLLTTVSALALLMGVYGASESRAADEDTDRPTIWIELGGQMEHVNGQGEAFAPAFLAVNQASSVLQSSTPLQAQQPPSFSFGEEGKVVFQPDGSDWVFSASARFGRSSNVGHVHHQTYKTFKTGYKYGVPNTYQHIRGINNFSDTHDQSSGKPGHSGFFRRQGCRLGNVRERWFIDFESGRAVRAVFVRCNIRCEVSTKSTIQDFIASHLSRHIPSSVLPYLSCDGTSLAQFPRSRAVAFVEQFDPFNRQSEKRRGHI